MKSIAKIIYLNLRRTLLSILGLFFVKRLQDFGLEHGVNKILFIRIDRIGDLVLSTPALRALKHAIPTSDLTVLASLSNQPILINNPYVDRVIVYNQRQGLKNKIRIMKRLRKYKFDLAIDPYPDYELRTALIALLSGAKRRIGYALYGREAFFNLNGPTLVKDKHLVDLTLDIVEALGVTAKDKTPEIFLSDDEKKWARNWLKEKGVWGKPIVGIHPGGYYESQRWLPERFAELVNQLQKDKELYLIIFCGPGEEVLAKKISSMVNQEVLTHVEDDIRRFAVLLSYCSVFICNNSGPLHIAVALRIPTISIMGPTIKDRWMPIGDIHRVLRIDNLPCIGCNSGYCKIKTHDCMRLITPSMVLGAVRDFLRA